MSIIRGIRSLSNEYSRNFATVTDTEENIKSCIAVESDNNDTDCYVALANIWPESISLNVRILPEQITNMTFVERIENGISLGKNYIYKTPIIHHNSILTNPHTFCEKLKLKFENSGEYYFNNKTYYFFQNKFNEYTIELKNNYLYEKIFATTQQPIIEKIGTDCTNESNTYRIYPYGGFYEYGAHPQEIETCIFQINSGNKNSAIKIWKLNTFKQQLGIDPTKDSQLPKGAKFIGIKTFLSSQKMSLYEELTSGMCTIFVFNTNTNEKNIYKSNSVFHEHNTDLIKVNFIKSTE